MPFSPVGIFVLVATIAVLGSIVVYISLSVMRASNLTMQEKMTRIAGVSLIEMAAIFGVLYYLLTHPI